MKGGGEFPAYRMARDLAGKVFPVSETVILQTARKHGIGRKMGRAVIFSPEDCTRLYEVLPCPSGSSADQDRRTGSFAGPSGESALKRALALTTKSSPRKSVHNVRAKSLPSQSTVVPLPQRLPRRP